MKPFPDRQPDLQKNASPGTAAIQPLQMRDLHHRMRNSLHLIACTLQLQSRQAGNAETRYALDIAARRIDSVARVHEHLYGNGIEGGQPARDYVSSLLRDLHDALLGPGNARMLSLVPGTAFALDGETLMPLGSIVVELVTNAVKYSTGHVKVTLEWHAGQVEVLVEDEGGGFPPGFDPARDAGFGLRLVHHLCVASGGALTIDARAGHGRVRAVLAS